MRRIALSLFFLIVTCLHIYGETLIINNRNWVICSIRDQDGSVENGTLTLVSREPSEYMKKIGAQTVVSTEPNGRVRKNMTEQCTSLTRLVSECVTLILRIVM